MIDRDADNARETEAGYDAVASDYDDRTSSRSGDAEAFAQRFLDVLAADSVVVDLGCGSGRDLDRFAEHGHRAVGLDRSAQLLALAGPSSCIRGDLRFLPLAPGSVGGIWSHASLLHVKAEALTSTLVEWERVLRPGGVVGLSTSLGGDSGWELAPASRSRVPKMEGGARRWFVHHDRDHLLEALRSRSWELLDVSIRSSHRDWLQVMARREGEDIVS